MNIQYTPKFIRLMKKLEGRGEEDTKVVLNKIESSKDLSELYNILDIKKFDIGGYRIRYSGKPEMRIRFVLVSDSKGEKKKTLELRWVWTREDYERIAHTPMNESRKKKVTVIVSESQFERLIIR